MYQQMVYNISYISTLPHVRVIELRQRNINVLPNAIGNEWIILLKIKRAKNYNSFYVHFSIIKLLLLL